MTTVTLKNYFKILSSCSSEFEKIIYYSAKDNQLKDFKSFVSLHQLRHEFSRTVILS